LESKGKEGKGSAGKNGAGWAIEKKKSVDRYFTSIAHRYDLADLLLSFGLHWGWKKAGIRRLGAESGGLILDCCGGTADLALLFLRTNPGGRAIVYDFNRKMLEAGKRKAERSGQRPVRFVMGDGEKLSFRDHSFHAVVVGFGIRNLADPGAGLAEIYRVLKAGGKLMILEFSLPVVRWLHSLYDVYSFKVMPWGGRIITGAREPFEYLARSIRAFPAPNKLEGILRETGFTCVTHHRYSGGLAVVYTGKRE
jgi:demethylmenaquinone methyltransferase/2-methoxy-6-polyprenyl-1,4-benzoquinol methylase